MGVANQRCYCKANNPSNKSAHQGCSEVIPRKKSFCFLLLIKECEPKAAVDFLLLSVVGNNATKTEKKRDGTIVTPALDLSPSSVTHLNIQGRLCYS